jgi:hypothetical protein
VAAAAMRDGVIPWNWKETIWEDWPLHLQGPDQPEEGHGEIIMKNVLIGILMAGSVLFAQVKDVDGWGKIKWGMTIAQVKAVYGAQVQNVSGPGATNTDYVEKLAIMSLLIGGTNMKVTIETAPGSDLIKCVSMKLVDDPKHREFPASVRDAT